ncbi:MAG: protein kinase [Pirellulaceae bacterium]|nr:protein kinase [Pirellulaceae bacterium]
MTENTNSEDREDQLEKITEEFLLRLRQKENPSTHDLAKQHPELAPELEKRLKLVESIFKSAESDDSEKTRGEEDYASKHELTERGNSTVRALSGNFAARFACPHCGNKVQLVGIAANEVTCGGCGSSLKIARPTIRGANDSALPQRLGRFEVKRILGEGAFGIVFLARDPQLNREVAVKTPRNGFFPSLDEERRFFREARHAASLQHPNIVQVFEVSDSEGAPLIVSEYISGLTLNDVANGNLLSFKETAKLMIQIANAVEFAHQKGVIHRDLKPSNILLDADQNAYITDFGLAYRDDAEITMTMDGAILGTPAYMAPEQAEGNQKLVGRRSDVYSLGVILYRLTTKDLPFHGTKRMLVKQVIHDDPKPPRLLNDRIPRDLETIILKAMSKSPDARYQTAAELAEELQRYLMGEPIIARPVSNLARFSRWCWRRPAIAALSGSIAALLLACATISTLWAVNSNRLSRQAIQSEKLATQNGLESSHRLHDLLMNNGVTELKENNLTTASLWFAEALTIESTPNARLRLSMIQDRMPTLTHLMTDVGSCQTAFSADGSRLVSAHVDRVKVTETETGRTLFDEQLVGEQMRFAPDGSKLAVGVEKGATNSIALWSVDKRRLIATLEHSDAIQAFEFDSSSENLLTGSGDSTAKIWKADDGTLVVQHKFDGFRVARATFIKGTTSVALVLNRTSEVNCKVVVWDYLEDKLVGSEMLHDSFVDHLRISSDGKLICAGEDAGSIKVWDVASGNQVGISIQTNKKLLDAQFTGQDKSVIGMFANGEIATYDYQSGALQGVFVRPTNYNLMSQSPDTSILALASAEGKVLFIWRRSGTDVCTPIMNGPQIASVAFHPDGHRVAVAGSGGTLQMWDLVGSAPNVFNFQHAAPISNACFVPKNDRCVTVSIDGQGYIWDNHSGQRVGAALEHTGGITCLSISSDGRFILTGGKDKLVKLWDSLTGKPVGQVYAHETPVTTVRFSPDGLRFYSSEESGVVRGWDINATSTDAPKPLFEVQQNAEVTALRLSPDGSTLASTSVDGAIRLWDTKTGQASSISLKQNSKLVVLRFMPDGKRLITGGEEYSVVIWEIATGKSLLQLPRKSRVWDIQVTDNGKRIVVLDLMGTATIWIENEQGSYVHERDFCLPPNVNALGARLNEEKSLFVMGGGMLLLNEEEPYRGSLKLWDPSDGRPLAPNFRHRATIQQLALSENADSVLSAMNDNTAQLWRVHSTNVPAIDLLRISRLYAQQVPNAEGSLTMMDIELQSTEFAELSAKYPAYFTVDQASQKIWDYEAEQNSTAVTQ